MFFLKCLNDDKEVDDLIKREIDCRTRFVLCSSENARNSEWVREEVKYIKSKNRICETIDLSKNLDEIKKALNDFITKTRLFISFNHDEMDLAKMVYKHLSQYEFYVHMNCDDPWNNKNDCHQNYEDTRNHLYNTVIDGFVISIITSEIFNPVSCSRDEIVKALNANKDAPRIIPFILEDAVAKRISADDDLNPLIKCEPQILEGQDKETRCVEIVKKVLIKLMTPSSIKVMEENLKKDGKSEEADFLMRIFDNESKDV